MDCPRLNIITPCSRPENLERIAHSISRGFINHGWHGGLYGGSGLMDVRWWIVFDKNCLELNDINKASVKILSKKYKKLFPIILINDTKGAAGHQHRNLVLDMLEEKGGSKDWIYNVDDDNILHENFYKIWTPSVFEEDPTAIVVDQLSKDGEIRIGPSESNYTPLKAREENMKVYFVDTAQVIFNFKKIKGMKFNESRYNADGLFIEDLFDSKGNFTFINEGLCYYNYLS